MRQAGSGYENLGTDSLKEAAVFYKRAMVWVTDRDVSYNILENIQNECVSRNEIC